MPGHVNSPGQIGPKKFWDILSFDLQMNSSLGFSESCLESIKRHI